MYGNAVKLKKSVNITLPGCAVNCRFCSLSQQYLNRDNQGKVRNGVFEELKGVMKGPLSAYQLEIELVAFWESVSKESAMKIRRMLKAIKENGFETRADIGFISNEELELLKDFLDTYHNNLETPKYRYPEFVGKGEARYEQKCCMLGMARKLGIRISSGVLLGLGETERDLKALAQEFKELEVQEVVVNVLEMRYLPRALYPGIGREEALSKLALLRNALPKQIELQVGYGWKRFGARTLIDALKIANKLHIGSFLDIKQTMRFIELIVKSGFSIC